jgi:integrase/recombinase XerD
LNIRSAHLQPILDISESGPIVKYEPLLRNKASLTLFWDLDARNHELTTLKIGNIRLRERVGTGKNIRTH